MRRRLIIIITTNRQKLLLLLLLLLPVHDNSPSLNRYLPAPFTSSAHCFMVCRDQNFWVTYRRPALDGCDLASCLGSSGGRLKAVVWRTVFYIYLVEELEEHFVLYLFRPHHRSARSNPFPLPHPFFSQSGISSGYARSSPLCCRRVHVGNNVTSDIHVYSIVYGLYILLIVSEILTGCWWEWSNVVTSAIGDVCADQRLWLLPFPLLISAYYYWLVHMDTPPSWMEFRNKKIENLIHFGISFLCNLALISFLFWRG